MLRRAKLRSFAKINLDLRVLYKRTDGYHELRTVFQTISLADRIEISYEPAHKTALHLDGDLNVPDNLVLRAAQAVLDELKFRAEVQFKLKKNVPMGAGLGGGSSNAATVLLALPVLAGRHIPLDRLIELGGSLGSDVPFFLEGGTSLGLGRGTEMYSLPDLAQEPLLLVSPGVHSSTSQAYQALGQKLTSMAVSPKLNNFQRYVRTLQDLRSASAAGRYSANDFEPAVFGLNPSMKAILGKMRKQLKESGVTPRMTGSGSTMFAIFDSKAVRDQAQTAFASDKLLSQSRLTSAALLNRSSYHKLWRAQLAPHATDTSLWPPQSRYAR